MSRTAVIRYETLPEAADENHKAVAKVFDQLAKENPEGLRYTSFRLADGVSFVHIVVMEGDDDPLSGLSAFQEFQNGIKERLAGTPVRGEATMIGSYRFLSD
ncbi:hypothetical protein ACH35V_01755 [Actinomadura sp. 1N219]|uniref:hypothetical protein n=1 Tax=Actinomadura sp. 1N219 TaxID=3375152 RepID=UPI0037B9E392